MALSKTEIDDKIEVVEAGDWSVVQIRTATVIEEDGTEISRTYTRRVINPGDDWSSESDKIKAICNAVHSDTTKAAYEAAKEAGPAGVDT